MQTAGTFLDADWDFMDERVNGTEDIWWVLARAKQRATSPSSKAQGYPRLWWELTKDNAAVTPEN